MFLLSRPADLLAGLKSQGLHVWMVAGVGQSLPNHACVPTLSPCSPCHQRGGAWSGRMEVPACLQGRVCRPWLHKWCIFLERPFTQIFLNVKSRTVTVCQKQNLGSSLVA